MKVGLVLGRPAGDPRAQAAALGEQVALAEANGFDCCLVAEHHGGRPSQYYPAPLLLASWLAARTTTLAVGTGIAILPLAQPQRLAEEALLLHGLSGGRVVLGVGTGYVPADFEPFGVPYDERVELLVSGLEALRDVFTRAGDAPPVWVAAWSPTGVRRAARLADGWLADPGAHLERLVGLASTYRGESADGTVAVLRDICIAERERELAALEPELAQMLAHYWRRKAMLPQTDPWVADVRDEYDLDVTRAREGRTLFGDADACLTSLRELDQRVDPDVVVLRLPFAGPLPPESMREMIELVGARIVPEVERWTGRG